MKMYKFECIGFDYTRISVIGFEVEEKPKSYKVVGNPNGIYESMIKKSDLDTVGKYWGNRMFSISPNKSAYIKKLLDLNYHKLVGAQQTLDELNQQQENLSRLYEMALEEEGKK